MIGFYDLLVALGCVAVTAAALALAHWFINGDKKFYDELVKNNRKICVWEDEND